MSSATPVCGKTVYDDAKALDVQARSATSPCCLFSKEHREPRVLCRDWQRNEAVAKVTYHDD